MVGTLVGSGKTGTVLRESDSRPCILSQFGDPDRDQRVLEWNWGMR